MTSRTNSQLHLPVLVVSFLTTSFVAVAKQPPYPKDNKSALLSIAYFTESANNTVNSITGLLKKDNYRNKIATLNNPANSELGFNLRNEIMLALEPLLAKAKKTDKKKFGQVIDNFLASPEEDGIGSVKKYMPALGLFSTVLSLVGNLVITEKNITKEDLNQFIAKIQQYFSQYEKLNAINQQFSDDVARLIERSQEIKDDLKDFVIECISTKHTQLNKHALAQLNVELLIQRYYDPQKLQDWIDTAAVRFDAIVFPPDAPTTAKLLTSSIRRLHKEYEALYNNNYTELKELLASLKTSIPGIDEEQVEKTTAELDRLYNESRQADLINLNIVQVEERMNTLCRLIHTGK